MNSQKAAPNLFAISMFAGMAGLIAGILMAPKSGKETRAEIRDKAQRMKQKTHDEAVMVKDSAGQIVDKAKDMKEQALSKSKKSSTAEDESPLTPSWEE